MIGQCRLDGMACTSLDDLGREFKENTVETWGVTFSKTQISAPLERSFTTSEQRFY